ncbi:DUF2922 domain-containing protein [Sporosarcina sp. SG10008]|uniref:DUF2922 domain-containing protein n=1 Tax=Sporosarcina sp. SG10008 TaxID=3373103 RepID=UPI0037DCE094
MAKTLQFNFNTATDKKVTMTLDEPRTDLTEQSVEAVMQEIIASAVFELNGTPLATIAGPQIGERNVTELVNG